MAASEDVAAALAEAEDVIIVRAHTLCHHHAPGHIPLSPLAARRLRFVGTVWCSQGFLLTAPSRPGFSLV